MKNKIVEILSALTTSSEEVTYDIVVLDFTVVTACLVGSPNNEWFLVDTGLENSFNYIVKMTEKYEGKYRQPNAIVLTHGHFDHVGSIKKLIEKWNIPVYCHPLEMPYLTGQKDYPLGDPTVSDGLVAKISPSFPHTSIDISGQIQSLPDDGSIPFMPGWKWIYTPGHTEGHISLHRESDGVLIVGDALTTTKQESLLAMLTQKEKISGPPKYLTTDFKRAEESIKTLKSLNPSIVIPSHGKPMKGDKLTKHLELLTNHFTEIATPNNSQYEERL